MSSLESSTPRVAVTTSDTGAEVRSEAQALAEELSLPFLDRDQDIQRHAGLWLTVGRDGLSLGETGPRAPKPIRVDFVRRARAFRSLAAESRRQPLARALGLRHGYRDVVDATAGLAGDSFLIARMGCSVRLIERNVVLGVLIRDGLNRARGAHWQALHSIVERMTLTITDARDAFRAFDSAVTPEVIYIDPMYPPKSKAALARKEMRLCRRLVGEDPDASELLADARHVAARRVVVKRHRLAIPLAPHPSLHFLGKQVRYDVYLTQSN